MAAIRLFEQTSHAHLYSKYRPTYPKAVLDIISNYIKKYGGSFGSALDVACGSGQSTFYLRDTFQKCVGVDISEAQIDQAKQKCKNDGIKNIEFKVGNALNLPADNSSVDLVTMAQAWHWIEPTPFYEECKRVLKPNGCLAVYGYGNVQLVNKKCNSLVTNFYSKTLKGYWHERRRQIDNEYRDVALPLNNTERHDMSMAYETTLPSFIGYVSSWSGYLSYCESNPGNNALEELEASMRQVLSQEEGDGTKPSTGEEQRDKEGSEIVKTFFPVFVILGQKK